MSKSQANLTGIRSSLKKNIKVKEKKGKPVVKAAAGAKAEPSTQT